MILLIRKKHILLSGLFCCFFAAFAALLWGGVPTARQVFRAGGASPAVVVIDPGHGGEDGGAVSGNGVAESRINLAVSIQVNDLLRLFGVPTSMTRTEDAMVADTGLSTIRERKVSDIHNRVKLVNETPAAILISIHQNSLPSSQITHGAQVFWNRQEGAEALARIVQDSLNACINTDRAKQPKQIPDAIYLMKHVSAPAILVECGFLSNEAETALLQRPAYQRKLAAAITAGYLRRAAGEEAA